MMKRTLHHCLTLTMFDILIRTALSNKSVPFLNHIIDIHLRLTSTLTITYLYLSLVFALSYHCLTIKF